MIRAQVFKTILKICYKFFLVYLEIKSLMTEKFGPKRLVNSSNNLLSNLRGGKELKRATKRRSVQ